MKDKFNSMGLLQCYVTCWGNLLFWTLSFVWALHTAKV